MLDDHEGLEFEADPFASDASLELGEEDLPPEEESDLRSGAIVKINGSFGFISQDNGEADMFVMPASCLAFGGQIPPVGTPVLYAVVADEKTGRPRADEVVPADEPAHAPPPLRRVPAPAPLARPTRAPPGSLGQARVRLGALPQPSGPQRAASEPPWSRPGAWAGAPGPRRGPAVAGPRGGKPCGSILKIAGAFGFIRQDSGEADMFVMPAACAAFGNAIPPVGTRVSYAVVADAKTGRPRAEAVEPEPGEWAGRPAQAHPAAYGPARGGKGAPGRPQPYAQGRCPAAAPALPAARGWRPGGQRAPARGGLAVGTMTKDHGSFGFISLDSGGPDMFVMPAACAAFGGVLPPLHCRVEFRIVTDARTGRPRAEDVVPISF